MPEMLSVLSDVCGGPPPSETLEWLRVTVQSRIDGLVVGLGGQIDSLKTGAGVKGAAKRLEPAGNAARRDVEIEISRVALRSPGARPVAAGSPVARIAAGAMYSLIVSGSASAWTGTPFLLEKERFLEFTDAEVKKGLGDWTDATVNRVVRLPCVFAYEASREKDPLFGVVHRVVPRDRDVRIEYEIVPVTPFLTHTQFRELGTELGVIDFEFHRTHWAVKEVDLGRVLARVGHAAAVRSLATPRQYRDAPLRCRIVVPG